MTGQELFEALSFVDERYIAEAETARLGGSIPWKQILEKRIPKICGLWEHPAFVLAKRIVLLFFMFICFLLIVNSSYNPFIYFRF